LGEGSQSKSSLGRFSFDLLRQNWASFEEETLSEQVALIGDNQSITFCQLNAYVTRVSGELRKQAVLAGVVIGLCFDDPIRHLVLSIALLREGITQVALPPAESDTVQKKIAELTGVSITIGDRLGPVFEGVAHFVLDTEWGLIDDGQPVVTPLPANEVAALIFLGSGTTGSPKVIAISFSLLAHLIERDLAIRDLRIGEKHYCESSLNYYTAKRRTLGCLTAGVTVMLPNVRPLRLVDYCLKNEVQHMSLTASQASSLLLTESEYSAPVFPRLPGLKSLFVGSSPVSERVKARIRQEITSQLFVVYGTNEFGEATVAGPSDFDHFQGTVGKACPSVTLEVVDSMGKACAAGVKGYVRLKSAPMLHGYRAQVVDAQKNFRGGWYYPGDVGWLSNDGNLVYLGRSDDMMTYGGVNIYPREIETVLESHPAVREVAAFPLMTQELESLPFAAVCAKGVSEQALLDYCSQHLGWRKPLRIFFVNELPRNAAGKVLKRVLGEQALNWLSGKQ